MPEDGAGARVGLFGSFFSRVLRDSTPRFVGPSVGPSHFTFFWVFPLGEDVPSDYNNV